MKVQAGDTIQSREFVTALGESIMVPDWDALVHLQFRRFSGCPICNTHIAQFIRRHDEIKAAGVREIFFFHSSADEVLAIHKGLPFDAIADPGKVHYKQFGVEFSWRYALGVLPLRALLRGLLHSKVARKRRGGTFGLPADILIAPSGRVVAAKYGTHAFDQWSVDELLAFAQPEVPTKRRRVSPIVA